MDLRFNYIANAVGVFILLILLYVSNAKILRNRTEDKVYTIMVVGVMIGCGMEALSYAVDGQTFPGARAVNYFTNTYLYTFNLLLAFCVVVYVDLGLYGDKTRIWKKYKVQIAVGVIMLCATILNLFTPIAYTVNEQNIYERKPFSYIYYIVIMFYLITAFVVNHQYEKRNGARSFFRIPVFILPIIAGIGLQYLFYGLSLAWLSCAIGLTGLFMMQQNELAYVDSLVNTYNRQYMNHIISSWTSRDYSFAGIMFDIDDFKSINDTYGHTEGDRALSEVADVLLRARTDNEMVFRFAGDEFIVLKLAKSIDEMTPYLENYHVILDEINRADRQYKIELSYGKGFFVNSDLDTFMKAMDGKMYEMKQLHHKIADASECK